MVAIPEHRSTVKAVYEAVARRAGDGDWRPHLGASVLGGPCDRALWYGFRWATKVTHEGRMLRLFRRGHDAEAELARDLRAAGLEVYTVDPETGRQWRFDEIGGHVGGSMDGCARGVVEAPATWHVLEFKTHNQKSFDELTKVGVEKAKPTHFAQMQLYMHWSGMRRALYVAENKNTSELYTERVRYDRARAEALVERGRRVVTAGEPLPRLSERPEWFECKWCDHRGPCHEGRLSEVTCRTCCHATPELDGAGRWSCALHTMDLPEHAQRAACVDHVYIPALVPWPLVDGDPVANVVRYRLPDGRTLANGTKATDVFESRELLGAQRGGSVDVLFDPLVGRLRDEFGAHVEAPA